MQEIKITLEKLQELENQAKELKLSFARLWIKGYYWYCELYNIPNTNEEMQEYYQEYIFKNKEIKQDVDILKNEMDGETYVYFAKQFTPLDKVDYKKIVINKVYSERF